MSAEVLSVLSKFVQSQTNGKQQICAFQENMDKFSREAIVKSIPDVVHANSNAPNFIRLILESLSNSTQHRNNLMLKVMISIVTELCDSEAVPEGSAIDIVHVMSMKVHELNSSDLAELIQLCLKFIQSGKNLKGKWLSFFPMIFCELGKQSRVVVGTEYMTGMEYCTDLITTLCNTNVSTEDAVAFTAVLRELKIPPTTLTKFIEKLCAIIPEMEPQELPPFVYQLLFLCDQSDHLVPLQHLATYFQSKLNRNNEQKLSANASTSRADSMDIDSDIIESGSPKEILQAKATCIFHVSKAAAAGHPLGKEFLKFIRNRMNIPELVLVPFILEVALSLGGLPQLRDVIDLLRNVVQRSLQCNEKQRHSAWMRELMLGKEFGVQELLTTIMEQCTSEGDNICKGFELLAFSLLEIRNTSLPVRPNAAGPSSAGGNTQTASSSNLVSEKCWHIGSHILLQMIKKFPDSARLIVQKIVERLQDFGNDYQYIATISLMVQHNPLSMLECKVPLTALLYSMDYRSVPSAKRLYAGISPLFRSSGALRDSAFLVLRKLLHSCSEDARQVAVVGFLQIMKNFRFYAATMGSSLSQTSMSSQATVDVHHQSQTANNNRAFCSELINLLQSALSHQSVVRLTLYQSLPEVVSRNPELLPECIKMLRHHLKFFIDPESVIQVDMCVAKDNANIHVVEPLGQLIQAVLQTILRSGMSSHISKEDIDAKTEDEVDLGVLLLRKLANNMTQSTNDDYVFGDTQEPHTQLKIQTLSSVCVALADFCLAHNATKSKPAAKVLIRMHEMHQQFNSLLVDSVGKGKATKGKATKGIKAKGKENTIEGSPTKDDTPKVPKKAFDMCTLSLENISLFLSFVDESNSNNTRDEEILTYFKSQPLIGFRLWVVQSALDKYHAFRNCGDIEGLSVESLTKYSGIISHALLVHCQKARRLAEEQASAIYLAALNCLHEMVHGFCQHQPTKLLRLLMAIDGVEKPAAGMSLENQIGNVLKHFKDLLNHLLSGRENEEIVAKAVLPVIGVLSILSDQLDPVGNHYEELLDWMENICKDVDCCESSTVKALMNLLLHLKLTSESNPSIMSELAKEVRLAIGTLGDASSTKEPNKFSTINEDTASVVLAVLISKLDKLLLVVEWALPRIGVFERGDASPIVERSIYSRLKLITHALGELVDADIRPGPNSELVLKLATALYTTMTRVTKKQTKTILPAFRSLVRTISTQLTANLGTFISHVDGKEKEETKGVKRKRTDKEDSAPKMVRTARSIPALTYASEQYNQAILAISKRSKEDLTFGLKLTVSRDFRINADQVNRALETEEPPATSSESDDDEMEGHHSRNQTVNESRATSMARRARGRGRGRGKFTSAGKATQNK